MAPNELLASPMALAWAEVVLAKHGIAVVPMETVALVDRILAAPERASAADYQSALYAIYACPWPSGRELVA